MKILSGCGASTRGAGVGGALVESAKRFNFDAFVGVSYSAVVGVPLALGMYDEILNQSVTLTHNKFFEVSPMNKNGGLTHRAKMRMIRSLFAPKKVHSFGIQNVKPLLSEFVTRKVFQRYKRGDFPDVYVVAVDIETQEPKMWNVKEMEYDNYLKAVSASSRIPVWTQMQKLHGRNYFDGGVTDTNASILMLDRFDVRELVSIYPRPENFKGKESPEVCGIIGAINWTIDTMLKNVSHNDALVERLTCQIKGINLKQIFLPYVLKNIYDVDSHRLKLLQEKSIRETIKCFEK